MTVNYTTLLGLAQPVTGTEQGVWGQICNDEITALIEDAVAKGVSISVTAGDVTLSTTNGATNQARNAILILTGTPGTTRNVIAPSQSKIYVVINSSDSSVVIKGAATTGVTVVSGGVTTVAWNGTDFVELTKFSTMSILGGTANGVAYLNGSKVVTTGSALTFDGTNFATTGTVSGTKLIPTGGAVTGNGMYLPAANAVAITTNGTQAIYIDSSQNVGIGVTPSAWSAIRALELPNGVTLGSYNASAIPNLYLTSNAYYNGSNWIYKVSSNNALMFSLGSDGNYKFNTAPSGTAGNAITFTQAMTLDASGNLGIGTSSPSSYDADFRNIVISGVASTGISIISGTTSNGTLAFGDGTGAANYRGYVQYSHTNDAMILATAATERMRIDSSGNVGIGTSSPDRKLIVKGSGNVDMSLQAGNTTGYSTFYFASSTSSSTGGSIQYYHTANSLTFATNGSDRMTIDSSGNVGIGTSSPATPLHVVGTTSSITATVSSTGTALNGAPSVKVINTGAATTNQLAEIQFRYQDGALNANGAIAALRENGGARNQSFIFAPSNAAGDATERMRIDSSGNVIVGSTAALYPSSGRGNITINGSSESVLALGVGGSGAGYIYHTGTNIDFYNVKNGYLAFATNNAERMRIDSSGNVGIGTSSPGAKLDVRGSATFNDDSADADFRIESDANTHAFYVDGGVNCVSIGTSSTMPAPSSGTNLLLSNGDVKNAVVFRKVTVGPSTTVNTDIDVNSVFDFGNSGYTHYEIDVGGYGNNLSGNVVYKWVAGGYSNTDGSINTVVVANSVTAGSVTISRPSRTVIRVAIENTNATYDKQCVIKYNFTWA